MKPSMCFAPSFRTDMWKHLKLTEKPIVLYGMGDGADKVLTVCKEKDIPVAGVFASDEFARHNWFHGHTVITYAEAKAAFGNMIVLVCFGTSRPEVLARIDAIAQEQELYIPELPVYGDGLFTKEYVLAHSEELQNVFSALADEESKRIWNDLLSYRVSGNYQMLMKAETDSEAVWGEILKPTDREHFLDLGAYRGDTVTEFLAHVSDYAAITAIEPDPRTYQKLCENTDGFHDCRRIHAAAGNTDGTCLFSAKKGRGSTVSENGIEIPCLRVDSLHPDKPFTMVNIDVEGNERAAIEGMEETIRVYKPKLQIAAYHRVEDYFAIPQQILAIRPDYKVYIRHFRGIPAWDTNFYFI